MSLKTFFIFFLLSHLVYAQQDSTLVNVVQEIKIIGNKTTKERIIHRELPFELGSEIKANELKFTLERAKSNLLNTLLFNFVTLEPVYFDDRNISIYITVEERWYWWPMPIFEIQETNFNTWWKTKDLDRLNYGLYLVKENFRGRKEQLGFKFQAGYTEEVALRYTIPYINKKQTQGVRFNFSYRQNHELFYGTTNNVRDFYSNDLDDVKKYIETGVAYDFRPGLYNGHRLYMKHSNVEVADTISIINPEYLTNGASQEKFFSVEYTFKRNKTNFRSYPTLGHYFDFSIIKDGLGIADNNMDKLWIVSSYKKYWGLSEKLYFSTAIKGQYTFKEGPYFLYGGLGYVNNLVRGYEFYVIQGEHFALSKFQLRYSLMNNKVYKLNFIPFNKFNKIPVSIYLGAFFDAGYVDSKVNVTNNSLVNEGLYGTGLALDFVSYYDMVFRMEYSINRLNEHGFFLHFVSPI